MESFAGAETVRTTLVFSSWPIENLGRFPNGRRSRWPVLLTRPPWRLGSGKRYQRPIVFNYSNILEEEQDEQEDNGRQEPWK